MANFLLIIVSIAAGMIIARLSVLPKDSYKSVNAWVLYVAIPALLFRYIPEINIGIHLLLPALGPIIVWGGAVVFVKLFSMVFKLDRTTKTALFIGCALGNTGFMGLPMVSAFYGEDKLPTAVIFDQITFLLFTTLAIASVLKASAPTEVKRIYMTAVLKLLRFPPFISFLAALILPNFVDISPINPLFDKLAVTMSPMALFSIGLQVRFGNWRSEYRNLIAGMTYKLIIAPLLILIAALLIGASSDQAKVSIMLAAMPSHVTASLFAAQYGLNPNLSTLLAGLSIAFSFLTTFIWWLVSNYVF